MTNQDAPATRLDAPRTHRFVPVAQAARILGLSPTTIRRKIDAGELEAERVVRPQGTAFLVRVASDEPLRTEETPATPQDVPGTNQDAPAGTEQLATVVIPLIAQIDGLRQTVDRQADTIRDQAERLGRQGAELERATSALVALGDELASAEASRRRDHRRLRIGLVVAGAVAIAATLAPGWVR
jgi:excisionase family DNA binding protein